MALQDLVDRFIGKSNRQQAQKVADVALKTFISPAQSFGTGLGTGISNWINAGRMTQDVQRANEQTQLNLQRIKQLRESGNTQAALRLAQQNLAQSQSLSSRIRGESSQDQLAGYAGQKQLQGGAFGLASQALSLGMKPLTLAAQAGIGATIGGIGAKLTGGDVATAVGESIGKTPQLAGFNRLTTPILQPITNSAFAKGAVGNFLGRVGAGGVGNTIQDEIYTRLVEQRIPSLNERALSFLIGGGSNVLGGQGTSRSLFSLNKRGDLTVDFEAFNDVIPTLKRDFNVTPKDIATLKKYLNKIAKAPFGLSVREITPEGRAALKNKIPTTAAKAKMTAEERITAPLLQQQAPRRKPGELNLERFNLAPDQKAQLNEVKGAIDQSVVKQKEVIKRAKSVAPGAVSADEELDLMARGLRNRQEVVAAQEDLTRLQKEGATLDELTAQVKRVKDSYNVARSTSTLAGRLLNAQKIIADGTATPMQRVFALLDNAGVDEGKYLKEAATLDWENPAKVVSFYRKYVPAKLGEYLDEFRYTNMLSSPLTHIINVANNTLQSAVVKPVEKTFAGIVDAIVAPMTGRERRYFASQGLDYARGYWKALPDAWSNMIETIKSPMVKTVDYANEMPASASTAWNLYRTPLKALEASDQFFRTLSTGGEMAALKRAGITGEAALKTAQQKADYTLFRQNFDPKNELGQGYVLSAWDKWNKLVDNIKSAPGGKWIVPFVKTPTNILKQGVEYSPAGLITLPGNRAKVEQLAKVAIGSGVFSFAYALANAGKTTWAYPDNKKEKDAMIAAGIQPYSIKIGDNWYAYSKLGPLAYPIAMAVALREVEKRNPNANVVEKIGKTMPEILQFFGDQSYVQQIGDFIEAMKSETKAKSLITSQAANMFSQLIPYRAFQSWVARIIDPTYRKAETFVDKIKSQIPKLSEDVPAYTTPTGQPSMRDYPLINAISPVKISQEKQGYGERYRQLEQVGIAKEQLKQVREGAQPTSGIGGAYFAEIDQLPEQTSWNKIAKEKKYVGEYRKIVDDQTLPLEAKQQLAAYISQKTGMSQDQLNYKYFASMPTDEKTAFVMDRVQGMDEKELLKTLVAGRQKVSGSQLITNAVLTNLVDEGIISADMAKEIKSVSATGTGIKTKTAKARKPKAIKLPKTRLAKTKSIKTPKIRFQKPKAIKLPKPKKLRVK